MDSISNGNFNSSDTQFCVVSVTLLSEAPGGGGSGRVTSQPCAVKPSIWRMPRSFLSGRGPSGRGGGGGGIMLFGGGPFAPAGGGGGGGGGPKASPGPRPRGPPGGKGILCATCCSVSSS